MANEVFNYNGAPITFRIGEITMVNATEMAKPFGKRPTDWLRLPSTQSFMAALSDVRNSHNTNFVVSAKGNSSQFQQGTWMHEDVALEFARWLSPAFAIWCNDRIKELMRFGMTATPQTVDAMLNDPDTMIRTLQALKAERERADSEKRRADRLEIQRDTFHSENRRLLRLHTKYQRQLETQAPKVEYADNILLSARAYTTTEIARELGMSARKLNASLHAMGVLLRNGNQWELCARYNDKGYVSATSRTYIKSDGRTGSMLTMVWTEAGRAFIHSIVGTPSLLRR